MRFAAGISGGIGPAHSGTVIASGRAMHQSLSVTVITLLFAAACSAAPPHDSPADGGTSGNGSSVDGATTADDSGTGGGGSPPVADGGASPGPPAPDGGSSAGPGDAGGLPDAGAHDSGGSEDAAAAPDAATRGALNPGVPPGGNFDLSLWELQEPVGSPGSPTTLSPAQLKGASGYHDAYFFTDPSDGAMTFWDPENGVTTANSNYPRSELREMTTSGAAANWLSPGTHTLSATVAVTVVPSKVAVGQIHLGTGTPSSTKPLLELFYYSTGEIKLGIEQTPAGGNEVEHSVGTAPLGTKWSYVIGLSNNTISLAINGGTAQTFAMDSSFNQEGMYFKAGNYDQSVGADAGVSSTVKFYALQLFHGP